MVLGVIAYLSSDYGKVPWLYWVGLYIMWVGALLNQVFSYQRVKSGVTAEAMTKARRVGLITALAFVALAGFEVRRHFHDTQSILVASGLCIIVAGLFSLGMVNYVLQRAR